MMWDECDRDVDEEFSVLDCECPPGLPLRVSGGRGVAVDDEESDLDEERERNFEGDCEREEREVEAWGAREPRGVAGTTVCVEVVDREEDEEDEGVGEYGRDEIIRSTTAEGRESWDCVGTRED